MQHWIVGILIAATYLTSARASGAQTSSVPASCRASIDSRLPGWHLSPAPEDLAEYAKQRKLETNVARADFDDDGTRDTAVLVLAPSRGKTVQYIAVCLNRSGQTRLYTIPDPYCGDGIRVAPKGTKAYDYQTGNNVTYRTNGVSAYCFEKAGGTYLFKNGRFELVVDSD